MNETISRLTKEREDREAFVASLLSDVENEERSLTDAELANIAEARSRVDKINEQLDPLIQFEESKAAASELTKRTKVAEKSSEVAVRETRAVSPLRGARSLGEAFINSEQFRAAGAGAMRDRFNLEATLNEVRDAHGLENLPLNTTEPTGSLFLPAPQKLMAGGPTPRFELYDAVNKVRVTTGSLDIVTYGSIDGAKTPEWVKEASSTDDGQKPWTEVEATSETIVLDLMAGLIDVTRNLLQDAPSIRGFIDQQLIRGIRRQIDNHLGDVIQGGSYSSVTGADWSTAIRLAMAQVEAQGYTPSVVLVSPATAAEIDLNLLGLLGGLSSLPAQVSPYGMSVITSPLIPDDVAYVGDFNTAVSLFERTGIEIFTTDSDKDKFSKNVFTILAETRCKGAVIQPLALVEATVTVTNP